MQIIPQMMPQMMPHGGMHPMMFSNGGMPQMMPTMPHQMVPTAESDSDSSNEPPAAKEVARYAVFEAWLSEFEKWHFDVFDESLKHQNEHSVRGFLHFKLLYM